MKRKKMRWEDNFPVYAAAYGVLLIELYTVQRENYLRQDVVYGCRI